MSTGWLHRSTTRSCLFTPSLFFPLPFCVLAVQRTNRMPFLSQNILRAGSTSLLTLIGICFRRQAKTLFLYRTASDSDRLLPLLTVFFVRPFPGSASFLLLATICLQSMVSSTCRRSSPALKSALETSHTMFSTFFVVSSFRKGSAVSEQNGLTYRTST